MSERLREPPLNHALRRVRSGLFRLAGPFDAVFRRLNHLEQYPPIHLRRHVSYLGTFDGAGYEFTAYLRLLLGLKESDHLLDLGCGCGMIELVLLESGWTGRLTGYDIYGPCIDWCRDHITPRCPSFRFEHADVHNPAYWPSGKLTARQHLEAIPSSTFDVVLAKSLFSHMLPDELEVYLEQVPRVMRGGGRVLLTFFLLNDAQERLAAAGASEITFIKPEPGASWAVRRLDAPTAAVAYREERVRELLMRSGLAVDQILPGRWSGYREGLSYQDLVVAHVPPK